MGVVFSGTKLPQTELEEIQSEIYADWGTFRNRDVEINEGHKSGADVYESKVEVNMQAHSTDEVTSGSDVLGVQKSVVNLTKIMFADTVNYETLLDTRFERSMAAGAFNTVSSEFDNKILQQVSPAIAQTMENVTWDGSTTAQKSLISGLSPGASQGNISSGAQTLVAASPTNLVNSLPSIILHNDSLSKDSPGAGIGDYRKVLSIATITSSTIADQYSLLYETLEPKVLANEEVIIFAPLEHKQLMKIANNSVGAASNQNFLFEGSGDSEKASYNGIEVKFKPLIGFMIASPAKYLKILFDLASDVSHLETGQMANGSEEWFYKNVQAYATWCTNQRYITLYGG